MASGLSATKELDQRLSKIAAEEQYRLAEIQNYQLYSPIKEDFGGAKEFARALLDMTEIEGELEKKRREVVLRSDFNLADIFRMFGGLSKGKRGVDCDDLYDTTVRNLELTITKDEVFIMFYKLNTAGNGLISYDEFADGFMPRSQEYKMLLQTRGSFYGTEKDYKKYFDGPTRELLKTFIKGFVDCEVGIELIRQRIQKKVRLNKERAYEAMDEFGRGVLSIDDFRGFIKKANLYPVEKNLALLFERFDKRRENFVKFDEFVQALTPFSQQEGLD